jgi:D-alanyl-lipoteichoic acid acyltransferase DltB (MBOAT superfamily)
MLFNSLSFLAFFPIVTAGYFVLPFRWRWVWLLAASCIFYMAFVPAYILILGGTIVVDYVAGILIEKAPPPRRRLFLTLSICSNLGILAIFKYGAFTIENVNAALAFGGSAMLFPLPRILLPIGLSFHTFQAMAYTMEVYRGRQPAERHFGLYALYVMFYPQLVAGPIERPQNILPQLKTPHEFDYSAATAGLKLMAWGFFQKMVVADRLATIVNPIFDHPREYHGLLLAVGAVAFTFEIYFDFAGYSDIAIGAAQVMGIKLMTNFRRPFFSKTIAEFWTRWHISLSTWFRDYLFLPMSRQRRSRAWWNFTLMVVFVLSGLWHGANWTFVAWGGLHGVYLVCGALLAPYIPAVLQGNSPSPVVRSFNVLRVFTLVCVASVFFRAANIGDAFTVLENMTHGWGGDIRRLVAHDIHGLAGGHGLPAPKQWAIVAVGLAVTAAVQLAQRTGSVREKLAASPIWVRWPAYFGLVYATVLFANAEPIQFIYFQF